MTGDRGAFWTTVPGVMSGVAALTTATVGVLTYLDRSDSWENPVGSAVNAAVDPGSNGSSDSGSGGTGGGSSKVTEVDASAAPSGSQAPCPVTISYSGTITVDGPTSVAYHWESSDGDVAEPEPLVFDAAGSKHVAPVTVSRSGGPGETVTGSMTLVVDSPGDTEDAADYSVTCQ